MENKLQRVWNEICSRWALVANGVLSCVLIRFDCVLVAFWDAIKNHKKQAGFNLSRRHHHTFFASSALKVRTKRAHWIYIYIYTYLYSYVYIHMNI